MTDRLIRGWGWVGVHRFLVGWAVAMLGLVAFSGGIAFGAARETAPSPALRPGPVETVARVQSTAVEAVVIGRRPNGWVVRTRTDELLIVRTSDATTYRLKNKPADANAVRRGAKVLILGRPAPREGVMIARVIAVRGQIRNPVAPPEAIGLPR